MLWKKAYLHLLHLVTQVLSAEITTYTHLELLCGIVFCKFLASRANQKFTRSDSKQSGHKKKLNSSSLGVFVDIDYGHLLLQTYSLRFEDKSDSPGVARGWTVLLLQSFLFIEKLQAISLKLQSPRQRRGQKSKKNAVSLQQKTRYIL